MSRIAFIVTGWLRCVLLPYKTQITFVSRSREWSWSWEIIKYEIVKKFSFLITDELINIQWIILFYKDFFVFFKQESLVSA